MTITIQSPIAFTLGHTYSPESADSAAWENFSDGALLEAVRAGRAEAYGTLFSRYQKLAISIARGILHDYELAMDAAQDAFSRILAAIVAGSGPVGTFKGYLLVAVTRAAYKQAKQRSMETPVAEHTEIGHPVEDFTDHLFDPALSAAFRSLPRRWQQVIWHLDVEDRQPRDIAPLFGLTPNALVALHRRAKKGLRATATQQQPTNNPT